MSICNCEYNSNNAVNPIEMILSKYSIGGGSSSHDDDDDDNNDDEKCDDYRMILKHSKRTNRYDESPTNDKNHRIITTKNDRKQKQQQRQPKIKPHHHHQQQQQCWKITKSLSSPVKFVNIISCNNNNNNNNNKNKINDCNNNDTAGVHAPQQQQSCKKNTKNKGMMMKSSSYHSDDGYTNCYSNDSTWDSDIDDPYYQGTNDPVIITLRKINEDDDDDDQEVDYDYNTDNNNDIYNDKNKYEVDHYNDNESDGDDEEEEDDDDEIGESETVVYKRTLQDRIFSKLKDLQLQKTITVPDKIQMKVDDGNTTSTTPIEINKSTRKSKANTNQQQKQPVQQHAMTKGQVMVDEESSRRRTNNPQQKQKHQQQQHPNRRCSLDRTSVDQYEYSMTTSTRTPGSSTGSGTKKNTKANGIRKIRQTIAYLEEYRTTNEQVMITNYELAESLLMKATTVTGKSISASKRNTHRMVCMLATKKAKNAEQRIRTINRIIDDLIEFEYTYEYESNDDVESLLVVDDTIDTLLAKLLDHDDDRTSQQLQKQIGTRPPHVK